jgi:hypothetical protein
MAIFISHSHTNKVFVDRLAAELTSRRRHVWVDRWELKVGDSILDRVQDALSDASALLIVLSQASLSSQWCRKELSAGLLRELEERRVVVLPILLEDCAIPLFLRDKFYADFRHSFDDGLSKILDATADLSSDTLGRSGGSEFHHDWAIDWQLTTTSISIEVTAVSAYSSKPYSILTTATIRGDQTAADKYRKYASVGFDWFARQTILASCTEFPDRDKLQILIDSDLPCTGGFTIQDSKTPLRYDVSTSCRRLGQDDGHHILYDYGALLQAVRDSLIARTRKPTADEMHQIMEIIRK